ncbi:MAG TPA: metal-dependent hydrolase [Bacillales bacterium]|nr:metal-dependent hydrolase [Bacillales bacterium]
MQYHTHLAFGAVAGIAAVKFMNIDISDGMLIYGGGVLLGSLLPDIDHPRSKISNKVPILPSVINLIFSHRSFFHSIVFVALLSLLYSAPIPGSFVTGLIIGVISHMIGDMMTNKGIKLLFPFGSYISLPLTFRTGGIVEQILFFLFTIGAYGLLMVF